MKQKRKMHFSLLELICVVSIVLTLMSILISSIKTSKDLAIRMKCMSNISQIRSYAELYRKDFRKLPYTETWLTDFTWAEYYMDGNKSLDSFICPGSEDAELTSTSQLKYQTSYYYVPNAALLEKNIEDGQPFGISESDLAVLRASENGVIYDRSPDHHNGVVNLAKLYKSDEGNFSSEGTIASTGDMSKLLDLNGDNTLDLPELADLDIPVADPVDPVIVDPPVVAAPATYDIVATAGSGGTITVAGTTTVNADGTVNYTITPDLGSSSEKVKSNNGHGNNEDGVDSSNPGNSKEGEDSDPNVDDENKSNGNSDSSSSSSSSSE